VIGKFEGADLTHPWAGNVIDLCPVGALVSKDFLNKAMGEATLRPTIRLGYSPTHNISKAGA
jgi:NADH-quinone oxidoreductase subunit G